MTEVASVLYGREDVRRRVEELGRTITGDYVGREPVLVTVLTGGAVFLADRIRAVYLPVETHFMAISRYGDAEESFGRVQILLDVEVDLAGRDVILVEDIVDTGLTSRYMLSVLGARGPAGRATPPSVRRLRLPGHVRRGLWPRLPRALSQPAGHLAGGRSRGPARRSGRPRATADGRRGLRPASDAGELPVLRAVATLAAATMNGPP